MRSMALLFLFAFSVGCLATPQVSPVQPPRSYSYSSSSVGAGRGCYIGTMVPCTPNPHIRLVPNP